MSIALASVACDSSSADPATRFGAIYLMSNSTAEPTQAASAVFYRFASTPTAGKCYVAEESGACRLWQCDDYSPTPSNELTPVSAGELSVSGASVALAFDETEPGTYGWENTLNEPLWTGGERLSATLAGSDEFPATTLALFAPDPIAVTAPVVPAEGWLVDSASDLVLGWSAAVQSNVYIAISISVPNPDGGADVLFPGLDCGYFGDAKTGVVPAAMLGRLAKPADITGHDISILTFSLASLRVEDAIVDFRATSVGLSALATIQ